MNISIRILSVIIVLVFLTSCSDDLKVRSEKEIVDEFEQAVANANQCSTDEECVLVHTECPLGCSSAVNISEEDNIIELSKKLKAEYSSGNRDCVYSCIETMAVCVIDKCETIPVH